MDKGTTLGQVCEAIVDCEHKSAPILVGGGFWAVGTAAMRAGRIDYSAARPISAETFALWTRRLRPRFGDLLLAREAPVGPLVRIPKAENVAPGQRTVLLRPGKGVDPGYLFALLGSGPVQARLQERAEGSTVRHLNVPDIRALSLPALPTLEEQRRIAATLGALDDKITSSGRTDELCLALAVETYRAACLKASQRLALGEAGKWLSGGTPSTEEPALWSGDFPWISAAGLKSFHVAGSDRRLTRAGLQRATNVVPVGTVLLVVRGMSLKSELRMGVAQRPVAFGQDVKAIIPTVVPSALLATALYSARDDILELVDEAGHGTGRLQWDLLSAFPIEIPDDERLQPVLDVLLARAAAASAESRKLAELRDALLPELLCGRIRVREAGEAIESALA
jgi:type I restriction enzyme S subunit